MPKNILFVMLVCFAAPALAARPDTDEFLVTGRFTEGTEALSQHLKAEPHDDVARFGLGIVEFVQSVERLGQSLAAYEFQTRGVPELRILFPPPETPSEPLTYPQLRTIIQRWLDDLTRVEATLAKIESEQIKLALHVGKVPLRLAGRGSQALTLQPLLRELRIGAAGSEVDFVITFDRADVDWLRGYCHLLLAFGEIGMSYDARRSSMSSHIACSSK